MPGAREIGRPPDPIPASNEVALVVLALLELVAVFAVVGIWREKRRAPMAKLIWTLITLVPVVGLLAYALWRDPPPPSGPTDRPPRRDWGTGP